MTLLGSMARPVFRYAAIGLAVLGTGVAVLASAGALARPAVGAGAPAYQVIDLGVLPGDVWSFATSINDAGHVAGISTSNGAARAFYWSQATQMIDLGVGVLPPDFLTSNLVISDNDEVVGTLMSGSHTHAFVWSKASGVVTDLGTLSGDTDSRAIGIDGAGRVVGNSTDSGGQVTRAFVWTATGGMVPLTVPGATSTVASAVSEAGQVIGSYSVPGPPPTAGGP